MRINFKKTRPDAKTPVQATIGSVGFDLSSADEVVFSPGETKMVSTGIALELPNTMEAQVRPRSGLSSKGQLLVMNSPGTIDPDYRGEIKVIMKNISAQFVYINAGDRIAQLVFQKREFVDLIQVNELDETERGVNGFGSTGI